jgi:hypothetical protein
MTAQPCIINCPPQQFSFSIPSFSSPSSFPHFASFFVVLCLAFPFNGQPVLSILIQFQYPVSLAAGSVAQRDHILH